MSAIRYGLYFERDGTVLRIPVNPEGYTIRKEGDNAEYNVLGLGPVIGKDMASWLCILAAAPVALAGFFHYNGMTLEQFLWAVVKSELLLAGGRPFASENFYYNLLRRKGEQDFD